MRAINILPSVLLCLSLAAQAPAPAPSPQDAPVAQPAPATETPAAPAEPAQTPLPAGPPSTEPGKPAETPASTESKAILLFYRESRFIGAGLRPSIFVDDAEVAWISSGSFFKVAVAPGDHVLYADQKDEALTFPAESGKTYYFRVGLRAGLFKGHGKLEPVSEETGAKEFAEWKLTYTKKILKPEMIVSE